MQRTSASGSVGGLFSDGNPPLGIQATHLDAAWHNSVQEELCAVIEGAGIALASGDTTQLRQAITAMIEAGSGGVAPATETAAGIVERATEAEGKGGVDTTRYISPAVLAAVIAGVARGYSAAQWAIPVQRASASGSQAVDCDLHQELWLTATGAITMATPTNMAIGKVVSLDVWSSSARTISWGTGWAANAYTPLPTVSLAGKRLRMVFVCTANGSTGSLRMQLLAAVPEA